MNNLIFSNQSKDIFSNPILFNDDSNSDSDSDIEYMEDAQIHLRLQQRTVRKSITIVEGMTKDNGEIMVKYLRKSLNTNGNVCKDSEGNTIIQFQGDKRKDIRRYLIDNGIISKKNITIHGF